MKKATTLFIGALLFSSILGVTSAHADDATPDANYTSNGVITFEADNTKTDPLDPENPDPKDPVKPIDPTDPEGPKPGTDGPLSIDYASSFQFGTQKITTADKDYYAQLQKYQGEKADGPNYVQVTDKRGSQKGWNLSVTQNGEFKTSDGDILDGASLSLSNGVISSNTDAAFSPEVVNANNTLVADAKTPLMKADEKKGMGTWMYRFGTDAKEGATSVKLSIPGKSVKLAKEYSTTLTWTLSDTPGN